MAIKLTNTENEYEGQHCSIAFSRLSHSDFRLKLKPSTKKSENFDQLSNFATNNSIYSDKKLKTSYQVDCNRNDIVAFHCSTKCKKCLASEDFPMRHNYEPNWRGFDKVCSFLDFTASNKWKFSLYEHNAILPINVEFVFCTVNCCGVRVKTNSRLLPIDELITSNN